MASPPRPLSPHLQIYKPQITSTLSILHRLTGIALGVGTLFLMWWLVAAASGPDYYAMVQGWLVSFIGRILLLGFTFALFYHLCNGIRHLFWDMGYGFDLNVAARTGWIVVIASVVLTLGSWIIAYGMGGMA
jgi:succinate dehydrogenase / fumarate reductase cytochrome b subunit